MKKNLTFDRIVGLADGLPLLQKETLIEILSRRLIEERRDDLRNDIQAATREFKAGKCREVTAAALMKEITG
ncbi:MAG: hypothetical protein ABIH24_05765 [Verrucomicrobiota bacterium]